MYRIEMKQSGEVIQGFLVRIAQDACDGNRYATLIQQNGKKIRVPLYKMAKMIQVKELFVVR